MLNNTCTQVVMISILQWIVLNGYENDVITNPDHSRILLLMICNSWSLTPLSASFQLCRGCQFYFWRKGKFPEKTTDLSQVTDTICCIEKTSPWVFFYDGMSERLNCSPTFDIIVAVNKTLVVHPAVTCGSQTINLYMTFCDIVSLNFMCCVYEHFSWCCIIIQVAWNLASVI